MLTIDQEEFFANLTITQAYCTKQLQQPWLSEFVVLRTSLQPVYEPPQWFVTPPRGEAGATALKLEEWLRTSEPYEPARYVEVFVQQLAYKTRATAGLTRQLSYPGRILVVEYGSNIPDGAVEIETAGFFDEFDLPPLDTWFYHGYSEPERGILFAWIPEQFVDLAQLAIDVQFMDILHWFVAPPGWQRDPYTAPL